MSQIKVDNIQHTLSSNDAISLASDSSVSLKHSGNTKLVTSSSGVSVTGTCTATAFSGDGANLTNVPAPSTFNAANLTGTLPAIDGSNLTGISTTHPAWFGRHDQSTGQGIPTDTWTGIANLGNDSVSTTGWNSTTGIFTVPSGKAGVYYAFGAVAIDDIQSDDVIKCGISKNGDSSPGAYGETRAQYSESNGVYQAQHAQVFNLAVGDTLQLYAYHNEGSTEPLEQWLCQFGGFRIFAS